MSMNKRVHARRRADGPGPQFSKLHTTSRQRRAARKWFLYSAAFLCILLLQDVVVGRLRIFGICPSIVPVYILTVCMVEGAASGGVFALVFSTFWAMSGVHLGGISILVLTFYGVLVCLLHDSLFRQSFALLFCSCLVGVLLHEGILFALELFLGAAQGAQWPVFVCKSILSSLAFGAFYPLAVQIRKTGGV